MQKVDSGEGLGAAARPQRSERVSAPLPRFSPPPQARQAGLAESSLVMSSSLNVALLVQRKDQQQ